MSRPYTKRGVNRAEINAETVRGWFGKGGQRISQATIDSLIEAAAHYAQPSKPFDEAKYRRFVKILAEVKSAKKAAQIVGQAVRALSYQDLTPDFKDFLNNANAQAEALYGTLSDFNHEVEKELNAYPEAGGVLFLHTPAQMEMLSWPEVAERLLPLIRKAIGEAGFSSAATSKKTRLIAVLRCFLINLGWSVTDGALEQHLARNTQ